MFYKTFFFFQNKSGYSFFNLTNTLWDTENLIENGIQVILVKKNKKFIFFLKKQNKNRN